MTKIYGFRISTYNVTKLLFTAEELDIEYEYCVLNLPREGGIPAEHRQRHPLAKVPVLEDEQGNCLFESAAICRYLAVQSGGKLYGSTASQRANVDGWLDLIAHHVGVWLARTFREEHIKPVLLNETPDQAVIKLAKDTLESTLPAVDQQLEKNPYLTGESISIADTIACAYFTTTDHTSIALENYQHIQRWYAHMIARPAYQRAMAHYEN